MIGGPRATDRAISPVVGVTLLVAIVVTMAAVAGGILLDLSEEREPAPEVSLELEESDDLAAEHRLVHDQGQVLDGDDLELRGAADPEALSGSELSAADRHRLIAVEETIRVVWFGEHGTSHVLREFDADGTVPEPDEGCAWVDTRTSGGVDQIKIDGKVVDCDVVTDDDIKVRSGGVVIGEATSGTEFLDVEDGRIYGDVTVEQYVDIEDGAVAGSVEATNKNAEIARTTVQGSVTAGQSLDADDARIDGDVTVQEEANVQDGVVAGSVEATTKNAKIDGTTVRGTVTAGKEVEVVDDSSVAGAVSTGADQVKVLDSTVSGPVATDGNVKLDGATVEGEVYVDGTFDCTDSTIAGQDCGSYSPKSHDDY